MKQIHTPSLKNNSLPNISFLHPTLEKSHEKNIELMPGLLPQPATGCMTNELEFTSHSSGMRKSTTVRYLHQASSQPQTDEFLCRAERVEEAQVAPLVRAPLPFIRVSSHDLLTLLLATFLITTIKYLTRSKLREEVFFLGHGSKDTGKE